MSSKNNAWLGAALALALAGCANPAVNAAGQGGPRGHGDDADGGSCDRRPPLGLACGRPGVAHADCPPEQREAACTALHLEVAFDRQVELTDALANPAILSDASLIRETLLEGTPTAERIRDLLFAAQASVPAEVAPIVEAAIREHDQTLRLAAAILAPETDLVQIVEIHFPELLTHGAVTLANLNLALSLLGLGPSAPGGGHVLRESDLIVAAGYEAEILVNQLDFASVVTITGDGRIFIGEAGYAYGNIERPARVLRLVGDGTVEEVASGFEGPLAGIAVLDQWLFVSHRGTITRIDMNSGERTDIVTGLPSFGDHFNENIEVGPDGFVYFTQGTVTNTGVVGLDNYFFGWLPTRPDGHDVPCRDYALNAINFRTGNPLTDDVTDVVETGAFQAFGDPATQGEVVEGQTLCSGAVLRVRPDGSGLEVFADGLRNPYGLAIGEDGRVLVTENGPDARGSRPLEAPDNLWQLTQGAWYGWPDYYGGQSVTQLDPRFPGDQRPVIANPPSLGAGLLATLDVHSASNGLDIVERGDIAAAGTIFIAQFGDLSPPTAGFRETPPHGFRVLQFAGGAVTDLLTSKTRSNGEPFLRPTDVAVSPSGDALYVVHFGDMRAVRAGVLPTPETGALIRITRAGR